MDQNLETLDYVAFPMSNNRDNNRTCFHETKEFKKRCPYFPRRNDNFSLLYSSYVLLLLLFIFIFDVMGRSAISVLLPFLKKQLNITDERAGLLTGPLYYIVYCLFGIICGKLGDMFSRKLVIFVSIVLTSIVISVTGFSRSYWFLVLCRMSHAAAISGASFCSVAFLNDFFPPYYRTFMQAIYSWGLFIGVGVGYAIGGIENSDKQDSDIWRYIFYFLGCPTIIAAFLFLVTVKSPVRRRFDHLQKKMELGTQISFTNISGINEEELIDSSETAINTNTSKKIKFRQYTSTWEVFSFLIRKPTFILICLACGCRAFASLAMSSWLPQFFERDYNINSIEQAKWLSWIIPLGGALGFVAGGYFTEKLLKRNVRAGIYISFFGSVLSIPFILGIFLEKNPLGSIFYLFPYMIATEIWTPAAGLIILSILPVSMRPLSFSIYYFIFSLFGGFGPLFIGLLATSHGLSLRLSMLTILPIFHFITSCLTLLSALTLKRDINAKNAWENASESVENIGDVVLSEENNDSK